MLARQVAQHRDTPIALGLAVWGGVHLLVTAGAFDLAQAELDAVSVPTTSSESMQLVGMLQMCKSLVAAADNRPGDVDVPLVYAAELAGRIGEGNAYGMGFGPTSGGLWRMYSCLDVGDYAQAVRIGDGCTRRCTSPRWCRPTTGSPTAGRGCGAAVTMPSGHCIALKRSRPTAYTGTSSPPM